ncbi:WbqC family protein [soil metagenome]
MHKAFCCDVFVLLDTVQYQKGGVQNRNQIKTAQGRTWLTVPVQASLSKSIRETEIANFAWLRKHQATIQQSYPRAAGLAALEGFMDILNQAPANLASLNGALMRWMFSLLRLPCQVVDASQLNVSGKATELVRNICQEVGATSYLSGPGAKSYMEPALLEEAGIGLVYHSVEVTEYSQMYPQVGFLNDLSALDLILNLGDQAAPYLASLPPRLS